MKTFPELKKNCKKTAEGMPEYRLAVLGDCATQHLSQAIKGYAFEEGIALNVFDADYNQIMAQVMDPSSEMYEHKAQAVLIDMCTEKLYEAYRETAVSAGKSEAIEAKADCGVQAKAAVNVEQTEDANWGAGVNVSQSEAIEAKADCGVQAKAGVNAGQNEDAKAEAEVNASQSEAIEAKADCGVQAKAGVNVGVNVEQTEDANSRVAERGLATRLHFAENKIQEIVRYWDVIRNAGMKVIQFNFPEIDDRVLGNYGAVKNDSFINQLRKLNIMLGEEAAKRGNVYIIDVNYIQTSLGRAQFADSKLYFSAKMPYSLTSLPYIGKEVIEVIKTLMGKLRKCLVLDLDNTLWGGVIGDDGLNGIQIGELGIGHAFQAFQEWLLELKKTGIILCVCSKNDDDKAREPFEKHPEMVLKLDDFAMFTANWQDKASNIIAMANTLNLNTDSFVFVDDNPFERDQVRSMVPGITVPDMPEDPAEYVNYLKGQNLFERITVSSADSDRTRQYQEEAGRKSLESSFASYDEYLSALEMKAKVNAFDEFQTPRIAQLSQRSNQFNLRTVRYTEDDVKRLAASEDYITIYFELKDKFGDHGLISVMVIKKMHNDVRANESGSAKLGSTELGNAQLGSTESGSAQLGNTESGSAQLGNTESGNGQLGSTESGSAQLGYFESGSAASEGFIENWFMSCRVLKRGMEEFIINTLNAKAKEAGLTKVIGEYIRTPKNNMVSEIYEKMGFVKESDTTFVMDVNNFEQRKTYITSESVL